MPTARWSIPATGETAAGSHQFIWNGKDNSGNQLADGTYKLTVGAKASDERAVTSPIASAGVVSEIDMSSGTPQLVVGGMEIGLGDIANVANAARTEFFEPAGAKNRRLHRERQRTKAKPAQGSGK